MGVLEDIYNQAHNRNLQGKAQSIEDFLEKYLDEDLLDLIEQRNLANILSLVRRLKSSLGDIMRKNGNVVCPIPLQETYEAKAMQYTVKFEQAKVRK